MINRSTDLPLVTFSVRVYQLLLIAYPNQFRQEYGSHMMHVFQDACLRAVRQGGTNGMLKFWALTLLDLVQSVISEHSQKEVGMKKEMKPEDIRRAGWALIFGGISLVLSIVVALLETSDWSVFALILLVFISQPLLVFGVLGLRNCYGEIVGSFGKNIILIGAILGPVTSVIGFFLMEIEPFWFVIYAGPAMLFICLTLFGVAALRTKLMPRGNGLSVIAGLSYPAIIIFHIITSVLTGDWSSSSVPGMVYIILVTIQGIALLALGYILKADVPEEKLVTA